jgi:hypothetical protein
MKEKQTEKKSFKERREDTTKKNIRKERESRDWTHKQRQKKRTVVGDNVFFNF